MEERGWVWLGWVGLGWFVADEPLCLTSSFGERCGGISCTLAVGMVDHKTFVSKDRMRKRRRRRMGDVVGARRRMMGDHLIFGLWGLGGGRRRRRRRSSRTIDAGGGGFRSLEYRLPVAGQYTLLPACDGAATTKTTAAAADTTNGVAIVTVIVVAKLWSTGSLLE